MHEGRLVALSVAAGVIAVVIVASGWALHIPLWISIPVCLVVVLVLTAVVRRVQVGRWTYGRRHWSGRHHGRAVEVVFDERLIFLNRLTLMIDGRPADRKTIWYGVKELAGDGVNVRVGSGWIGQCTGVVVTGAGGEERVLTEQR